jgi:hypothetical protein
MAGCAGLLKQLRLRVTHSRIPEELRGLAKRVIP